MQRQFVFVIVGNLSTILYLYEYCLRMVIYLCNGGFPNVNCIDIINNYSIVSHDILYMQMVTDIHV